MNYIFGLKPTFKKGRNNFNDNQTCGKNNKWCRDLCKKIFVFQNSSNNMSIIETMNLAKQQLFRLLMH